MKRNLWKLTLCAACLCAGGLITRAAELQRSDVIADPAWLLHLDCDGLRPTAIGQFILSEMDKPEAKTRLAAFQTIFGFDLRNKVHGVTLYGSSLNPTDGVLISYADFDTDHLVTLAKAASQYEASRHNGHFIRSWVENGRAGKPGADTRMYAAFEGDRVIICRNIPRMVQALDVLDGIAPSMADGKVFPELGVPGNGHFIEAAARKVDSTNAAPNAAIMKLSKNVQLLVGENQKQFQGALTIVGDNDEAAGQILSIAQGLMAVMKMQANNPDAVKLANAVNIKQDGSMIQGKLVLPASEVVAMMQAGAARMEALRAARTQSAPAADASAK